MNSVNLNQLGPVRSLWGRSACKERDCCSPSYLFYLSSLSSAGHFAKDCFMQPGGTRYSLIPDEEEEKEEAKSAELEKPDPTRNSSRKRKKVGTVFYSGCCNFFEF